jgi:Tfp pilus assembly protein PilF
MSAAIWGKENIMSAANMPSVNEALDFAVQAIARGDLTAGKAALQWVLQRDAKNPLAWIWMACCMPDEQSKRSCYRQIDSR